MNHYEVLHVARDAPADVIRLAYRALVRNTHPDLGGDDAYMKRLNEANRVLSDPDLRAEYDLELKVEDTARAEAEAAERARVDRRPRRAWGIAAAVAVVAVVVVAAALALPTVFRTASSPTESPGPTHTVSTPTPTSTPTSTPTPSPSLPQTASHIDLTRVADAQDLAGIAATLDAYFSGINAHDADMVMSAFAPGALSDAEETELINGTRTTHDDLITVNSISPATFDGRPGYEVQITFRSHQDPSQGDGQACTGWSATERLVLTSARPLMLPAVAHKTPGCPA